MHTTGALLSELCEELRWEYERGSKDSTRQPVRFGMNKGSVAECLKRAADFAIEIPDDLDKYGWIGTLVVRPLPIW